MRTLSRSVFIRSLDWFTDSLPGVQARVTEYEKMHESATAKRAARKLLRQIEASEERSEIIEARLVVVLDVVG